MPEIIGDLELSYIVAPDGAKSVSIPDDRRAFVIDYVRRGAAGTLPAIEALVQSGHDELVAALAGVSEAQARHKPASDVWSVLELMNHVVSVKQLMATLCRALGQGELPPGFGDGLKTASAQDGVTISRFATLADARTAAHVAHADLVSFIRGLDGPHNAELMFRHFLFGAFNSREWAVFQRIHDADHTPQIGQIKASAGFSAA